MAADLLEAQKRANDAALILISLETVWHFQTVLKLNCFHGEIGSYGRLP